VIRHRLDELAIRNLLKILNYFPGPGFFAANRRLKLALCSVYKEKLEMQDWKWQTEEQPAAGLEAARLEFAAEYNGERIWKKVNRPTCCSRD